MTKIMNCHLIHFKNYTNCQFEFHPHINALVGNNGMGKTNALDALHFMSFTKSRFLYQDRLLIQNQAPFFRISGIYEDVEGSHTVVFKYPQGGPKVIEHDRQVVSRASDYIGCIPMIFLAPDDEKLIFGGSTERRRLMDKSISQFDRVYLESIMHYNKLLNHRNKILQESIGPPDVRLLESIDQKMGPLGDQIHSIRQNFMHDLISIVLNLYKEIVQVDESISIQLEKGYSQISLLQTLETNRPTDIQARKTTQGIHRDDISFLIRDLPFRKFGSQGQIKSLLLSIQLAQLDLIKQKCGQDPILIIDDVFDKLDVHRINHLLNYFKANPQRQFFVSYTNGELLEQLLQEHQLAYKIFTINAGTITDEKAQ